MINNSKNYKIHQLKYIFYSQWLNYLFYLQQTIFSPKSGIKYCIVDLVQVQQWRKKEVRWIV